MSERSVADPRLFAADYCLSGPVRTLVHMTCSPGTARGWI
jgi:hypothetical protein